LELRTSGSDTRSHEGSALEKSLKAANRFLLVGVIIADGVIGAALLAGDRLADPTAWSFALSLRVGLATLIPVAVLLLAHLLPAPMKATLVYWRGAQALPGHRAFSVYLRRDPRIDEQRLAKNIGTFPTDPAQQNLTWYRLFKKVESLPAVIEAHRHFLLLRDLASISALLFALGIALAVSGLFPSAAGKGWAVAALFGFQYLLSAISARNVGVRLVTTVLAAHAQKKYR
jgi:hypothetical protein